MSYVSLAAALKTTLLTVPTLTVYDYQAKHLDQYPAATIEAQGHKNDFLSTAANRRQYTFLVRFYYPLFDGREDDAEYALRSLLDTVITTIEANVTLGGACDWARPTEGRWASVMGENPVRVVEVQVDIQKLANR